METLSALLALCEGNPPVTGGFPSQWQVTQSFDFFLWSAAKQTVKQIIETPVIWDAIALIMTSLPTTNYDEGFYIGESEWDQTFCIIIVTSYGRKSVSNHH